MSAYKDNDKIDEMVGHLIDICPELFGYTMDQEWRDKPGCPEVHPDRVLLTPNGRAVGMEFTELLPGADEYGSAVIRDDGLWQAIVNSAFAELRKRTENDMADHLKIKLTVSDHLPKRTRVWELAHDLAELIFNHRPVRKYQLAEVSKAEIEVYPCLGQVLAKVVFSIDADRPGYYLDCQCIDSLWFRSAASSAKQDKSQKVSMYRQELVGMGHNEPMLYLVLWCRNCTPVISTLFWSQPGREYAEMFDSSGFDAVWYVSGIRDNSTQHLGSSWRLFPAEASDPTDSLFGGADGIVSR